MSFDVGMGRCTEITDEDERWAARWLHQHDLSAQTRLIAVHPGAVANYNMGQLLVQRGRAADAAPYFVTALELDPTMQPAQATLASLNVQLAGGAPTAASEPVAPMGSPMTGQQQAPSTVPHQAAPQGPQLG